MSARTPITPATIAPTDTRDAEEGATVDVDVGRGPPVTYGWAGRSDEKSSLRQVGGTHLLLLYLPLGQH